MKIDLKNLPSNTTFLHQLVVDLVAKNQSLAVENERLKDQLRLLKAKRFGKSSEKLDNQIEELEQRIEESESLESIISSLTASNEDTDDSSPTPDKNQPKRKPLPENLERIDTTLAPDPKCPECGGGSFRKISDDISEILEYIPSSFKVLRYIRPRCACMGCEKIIQAHPASKTIDKGLAGPGLLSHIMVQKYCNHLPFYRQSQMYEREGLDLSRSTMASWAGQVSSLLEPLIEEIKKSVFSSTQIHGDDTPVKVLAKVLGKTKTGRIWTYVRDGRPSGDIANPPAVCYFYSPDRKGMRPMEHLKNFTGILHADAYAGYDKLYESPENDTAKIFEAACWAHTRRKFHEIVISSSNAKIADSVLTQISKIYEIEESVRGMDPTLRYKKRQESSKPLVEQLFVGLKKALSLLPNKSATANAINYALNNQIALMRFLDNGSIEIDNNAAERALRPIALGRKNWLFAGSDRGGETAAAMYTIIETAKLNNINPWTYLKYILTHIQDHNSQKIAELLPWNVKLG